MGFPGHVAPGAGQVSVFVACPLSFRPQEEQVWDMVVRQLEDHGRVFALVNRMMLADGTFQATAEFCSVSAASHAIRTYYDGLFTMVRICRSSFIELY